MKVVHDAGIERDDGAGAAKAVTVGAFAEAYANQTELDWKQLVRSLRKTGRKS